MRNIRFINGKYLSEQKIDEMAHRIESIQKLLQGLNMDSPTKASRSNGQRLPVAQLHPGNRSTSSNKNDTGGERSSWDHSAHIVDFVKTVVKESGSYLTDPDSTEVLGSLQSLLQTLESPVTKSRKPNATPHVADPGPDFSMPPSDAALSVLRWAKSGFTIRC